MSDRAQAPAPDQPVAQAFFCDDVRHEIHNKLTLVGIYNHNLYATIGAAPLPKLVAFLSFTYPLSMVGQIAEVVLLDRGNVLLSTQVPLQEPKSATAVREDQPPERFATLNIPIEMVGFIAQNGMVLQLTLSVGAFRFNSFPLSVIAPDAPLPDQLPALPS